MTVSRFFRLLFPTKEDRQRDSDTLAGIQKSALDIERVSKEIHKATLNGEHKWGMGREAKNES